MTTPALPTSSRVVVIGGGIIGCSVAYHLAHMGCEVLLLERDRLTSGTTWHAAGLIVTFGSTSETSTEMRKYSRDLYTRLPAETGQETGFRPCGFIEVAADSDRLEEYRRVAAFNRLMGIDVHELSPREVGELFPLARVDDILAGFYVKEDGRANPVDVTMALAKGAKLRGAKIAEGVAVTGVRTKGGAVAGVQTTHGSVQCETVVNCAGMWARELGSRIVDANGRPLVSGVNAGVNIPLQAAEHYYLITGPIEAAAMEAANSAATQTVNSAAAGNSRGQRSARPFRDWPVLEDPASYGYFREEAGGLMIGLFEPVCAPWKVEGLPPNFSFSEIEPDWERMTPFLEKAMARVPAAQGAGIKKFFCGPESFTPDLLPIVGPAPELKNYFVAAGLNSIGILTGGGIGRLLAHWILTGDPQADVTGIHIDRLHRYQSNPEYRRTRTVESLGMVYQCHYPTRSMATARDAKRSPLHDRLAARGAWFKDVSGWEGADWYAPPGVPAKVERLSWGRQNWFPYWRAEHEAARSGVILMDMSFMSKFFVQGKDAGRVLNRLSANNVDAEPGRITYTQWLNERGTIEADLTVTKFDDEHFMVVASDTAHGHAFSRLQRGCEGAHAFAADMTGAYAQINIQGPRSRELLQSVTSSDISDDAFPFRCAREIDLALARVLAIRITYLGELGYELYVPAEQAVHVYERLVRAGEKFDLRHAGLKALASLRMEKGYRDYGHDIDNTDSVLEAGLGFAVDLAKPGGFIGRDAVLAKKAQGPLTRRLLQVLVLDPEPMMFHAEPIYRDGRPLGYVRAASYGHTLGGAVGLAMIDAGEPIDQAWCEAGRWEIDIAGRRYPARASAKPMYDAEMKRIRA